MGEEVESPKARLRREFDVRRKAIAAADLARASLAVCERIAEEAQFRRACHLVTYAARAGEVDPAPLEGGGTSGAALYYPRVEQGGLVFRRGILSELVPGRFGIPEPRADAVALPTDARDVIVLVPGVAFDRYGTRLGTGKGLYDRALLAHRGAWRIGLTLAAWVLDRIPADPWDIPMHAIATERELLVVDGAVGAHPGDSSWN
jgi:5-formyltetrahydrofolate cyclo-ligase